jgi:selenocysteine lyase/cysteine desulfurase
MSRHGAIGNIGIAGVEPKILAKRFLDEHNIWTVAIDRIGVRGCRITPNVYTSTQELDAFVKAIKVLSGNS